VWEKETCSLTYEFVNGKLFLFRIAIMLLYETCNWHFMYFYTYAKKLLCSVYVFLTFSGVKLVWSVRLFAV
jgi:hypothetical protein